MATTKKIIIRKKIVFRLIFYTKNPGIQNPGDPYAQ